MPFKYLRTEAGEYQCPHCDYVRKNQSTVNMHIRAKHSGAFKFKCETCAYETSTKQNLDHHVASKHGNTKEECKKEYTCPSCSFASRTKAGLRSHYLLKHLTKETHALMVKPKNENTCIECANCAFEFQSKPAFVYHVVDCLPSSCLVSDDVRRALGLTVA